MTTTDATRDTFATAPATGQAVPDAAKVAGISTRTGWRLAADPRDHRPG